VTAASIRLYRLVLFMYPTEFRRRYRDEMIQLLLDRQRHEQRPPALTLIHETIDAVRTAPRMRWESPMNRTVIIIVTATLAIAAAIAAQVLLIPIALAALAAWLIWGRQPRSVESATQSRHPMRWLLAGGSAIVIAIAIPAIDGGELNGFWWTVMASALLGGIGMTVTAVIMATHDRSHRLA
jgi:hypothetical protein